MQRYVNHEKVTMVTFMHTIELVVLQITLNVLKMRQHQRSEKKLLVRLSNDIYIIIFIVIISASEQKRVT